MISAALIAEAERDTPLAAEMLKANRADKKAEALRQIEEGLDHCEKWIAERLESEAITKEEAEEARKAVADLAEELREQAAKLPTEKGGVS